MLELKNINKAMDYKKAMVTHLADLKKQFDRGEITEEEIINKEGNIVILTHTNLLEGTINLFETEEKRKTFLEFGLDDFSDELNKIPSDMMAFHVTGPIHLKDVTIRSFSNLDSSIKMSEMIIFSDQVVGVSIS
ncbi:hypothetical protein WAK64_04585 [Bacillus spongiae]|uniref:DUF2294 family protein n=1 Tax=Bacillus spongiae TaxID=2683610 RepID=A0ABU8HAZ4_9BACI